MTPHLKVKCKLHNAKSKDPIHSYFLSDTSKKWWRQSREKGRGADFEDFEETWKSGCTGTCFLLKGNNLALLCPALGGGHTSCWRNWELDKEFVKKNPRSKFLSKKTRLVTYSNLRQKCVNDLKWEWTLVFHTLLFISTFLHVLFLNCVETA